MPNETDIHVQEYTPKIAEQTTVQLANEKSAEPCYCNTCIHSRRTFMRVVFAGVVGVTICTAVSALNSQRQIRILTRSIEKSAPDSSSESRSLTKSERVDRNPEIRRLREWRDRMMQVGGAGLIALLGGAYLNRIPTDPYWNKPCGREEWLRARQSAPELPENQA